jgi:hypothetical protein
MDADNFRAVIKEILKESLREILVEEGLLQTLSESKKPVAKPAPKVIQQLKQNSVQEADGKRKLLEQSIQKSKLMPKPTGFDPFAGTQPLTEAQAANGAQRRGPLKDIDPSDPGLDVSSLIGGNKATWKALVGGKKK